MFLRIIEHEWRALMADRTALIAIIAFAAAISYALLNGSAVARRQAQGAEQFTRANEERIEDIKRRAQDIERQIAEGNLHESVPPPYGPRHPVYAFAWGWNNAALPPAPLAAISVGQSDLYPVAYQVKMNEPLEAFPVTEQTEYPLKMLIGHFDYEFVIVYLYPLLIIALSFNLITEEKEGGTLGLLLSQPLSMRALALGKIALRAALIFGPVVIFSAAGFLFGEVDWRADGVITALLLCSLMVVVYGALWLGLAILVNAYSGSSVASAVALVVCWLALAVLIPSAVNITATALHPVPSRAEFVNARRAADAETRAMTAELIGRFFDAHPEYPRDGAYPELGRHYIGKAAEVEEMARRMRPIRDRFDRQIAGRQAFIDRYRFLSPAILLQNTLRDLAGTGRDRYQDFLSQVEAYQQTWRCFFQARIFLLPPMTSSNYDQIPRFTYREQPLREAPRRMAVPLATMFVMTIAFGLLGLRAYGRYSVVS